MYSVHTWQFCNEIINALECLNNSKLEIYDFRSVEGLHTDNEVIHE